MFMKSVDKQPPIGDLDEHSFGERMKRSNDNTKSLLGQAATEKLTDPLTEEEIDAVLKPLQDVTDSEKDEFGNFVIPELARPLAPPIAPKSTSVGRGLLETLTSNPSYNGPKNT